MIRKKRTYRLRGAIDEARDVSCWPAHDQSLRTARGRERAALAPAEVLEMLSWPAYSLLCRLERPDQESVQTQDCSVSGRAV